MTTITSPNSPSKPRFASLGRRVLVLVLLVLLLGTMALLVIGLSAGRSSVGTNAALRPSIVRGALFATGARRHRWNPTKLVIMHEGILEMQMTPATPRGPTWAELSGVYNLLSKVARATAKYDNVRVARRDGYHRNLFLKAPVDYAQVKRRQVRVQRDFTHFPDHPQVIAATLNPLAPQTLVYRINRSGKQGFTFAGVMYLMPGNTSPAYLEALFPPSMAMWHRHINICVGWDGSILAPHDAATCYKKDGAQFEPTTTWMLHAWVGVPSGKGLFDLIPGSDPTTAAAGLAQDESMAEPTVASSRAPVIMVDGAREMKMLPLSGRPPTWLDVVHTYAALHPAQPTVLRFADPAAARRAGYLPAPALYAAGPGTHYLNPTYLAAAQHGRFDPTRPPLLVYSTAQGHAALAGVMYVLPQRLTPTDLARVFPSSLASWQRMLNTCVVSGAVVSVYDAATCAAQHGQFTPSTGWMVHAWIGQAGDSAIFDMDLQQR